MALPNRYKEIIDYFEALQVAGEMLDENAIEFKKIKSKRSFQILVKISLSNEQATTTYSAKSIFFKQDFFNGKKKYYFPLTMTLEREKDEILIHTSLPSITASMIFANKNQMLKMYENGIAYDLMKKGFKNVQVKDVAGHAGELVLVAGPNISFEDISELYREICDLNMKSFEAVSKI